MAFFNKVEGLRESINNYDLKTGKYCDKATQAVGKLEGKFVPFPEFDIKNINKTRIFGGLNKEQVAVTIMKLINKYGYLFASAYAPDRGYFHCVVPDNMKDSLFTHHYVNIAGVKKVTDGNTTDYYALIHNSWGGSSYGEAPIEDGYVSCNLLNGLFVIEPKV